MTTPNYETGGGQPPHRPDRLPPGHAPVPDQPHRPRWQSLPRVEGPPASAYDDFFRSGPADTAPQPPIWEPLPTEQEPDFPTATYEPEGQRPQRRGKVIAALTAAAVALAAVGGVGYIEAKKHHLIGGRPAAAAPATPTPRASSSARPTSPAPSSPSPTQEATRPYPHEAFDIAQTFIVGFDASETPPSVVEHVVEETHIGGIFLNDTNNALADGYTPQFFNRLSKAAGAPMIIAMDDEGGKILRNLIEHYPSAEAMGKLTVKQVKDIARKAGIVMHKDGVTLVLAPVLDLNDGRHDGVISKYDRSFGGTPTNIADKAGAFIEGVQSDGVDAVGKHYPGDGSTMPDSNTDAHKAVTPPLDVLKTHDLVPYQRLFKRTGDSAPSTVMLGNMYVQGLDDKKPASISPKVVDFLRRSGFRGVITTDDLASITKYDNLTLAQNIVAAAKAKVQMPLFTFGGILPIRRAIKGIEDKVPPPQVRSAYNAVQTLRPKR